MTDNSSDAPAPRPPLKVLFVHFGDEWIAGSEIALLEMLANFPEREVIPTLWCNGRAMEEAARDLGIPVVRDDFALYFHYGSPRFSPRHYAHLVREGARLISKSGADLVHCNSGAPAQWMRPGCWTSGVPMLVNTHSPYIKRGRYTMGLHLADRVVAVASAIAEPLLSDGMDPSRISVVYNGFDGEAVLAGDALGLRDALNIPRGAVVGAIAGSLIRRKGHDILFEAMRLMRGQDQRFQMLVIGDGPEAEAFKALAEGLPVHFLGRRNDLGAVFRDAVDFLVAPSRQEAFGRVIIEAAFAGIPAIGSDVDGIPEAIVDGETGLLTPPAAPAALATALTRLVGDKNLRRKLGQAARLRALEQFSISSCVDKMVEQYWLTLDRHAQSRGRMPDLRRLKPYWNLICPGVVTAP